MKPHSLETTTVQSPHKAMTPNEKKLAGGWAARHGMHWPKGTVLPETRVLACPRVKVGDLPEGFLKKNHIEALEQNQKIAGCCRHPENHEVEAHKSHPDEVAPDIYIFICTCGRKHRFLCVGMDDPRPAWKAG